VIPQTISPSRAAWDMKTVVYPLIQKNSIRWEEKEKEDKEEKGSYTLERSFGSFQRD
jgi:hypothetical protein